MGYLTTITIYNDGAHEITDHPKQFSEAVYKACAGVQLDSGYNYACVGSHANLLTLQKPRHADDHTLYLHAGNTVVDVYKADSEWAIDTFISEMEYHLKRLKKRRKELKNK